MEQNKADNNARYNLLTIIHDEIKDFKSEPAAIILENYKGGKGKFNRTCTPSSIRKNLSSTAICTYTITLYSHLWDAPGKNAKYGFGRINSFDYADEYWNHILGVLSDKTISPMNIEAPDEFTVLNVTSLLSNILQWKPKTCNSTLLKNIVEAFAQEYIKNQFVYKERGIHPFLYYRFLVLIENWKKMLIPQSKERIAKSLKEKYGPQVVDKVRKHRSNTSLEKSPEADNDWIFDWFCGRIYENGKYEMYRQIALYYANDKTLFDVKRLVYSILIVNLHGRYSNNFVVKKALEIIFKEVLDTGLLPISHVVDNDFVVIGGEIQMREVSAVPLLTSFECFTDMLSVEELREDLKPYEEKFRLAYEWTKRRLRKNSDQQPLGWFSEYESTHTPESWVAGHVLLFLKSYCELLSSIMKDLQPSTQTNP